MIKKTIAILIKILGAGALGMWFYAAHLYEVFRTYPTAPNTDTGNIVPFLWKTQNVFITEKESLEYDVLFYGAIILFGVAAISYAWAQKKFKDPALFPESTFGGPPSRRHKLAMITVFILVLLVALYSYLRPRFG